MRMEMSLYGDAPPVHGGCADEVMKANGERERKMGLLQHVMTDSIKCIRRCIRSSVLSVLFVPFVWALLCESIITGTAIEPREYQMQPSRRVIFYGVLMPCYLFVLPIVTSLDSTVATSLVVYLALSLVFGATIAYCRLRPQLISVQRNDDTLQCLRLGTIASIITIIAEPIFFIAFASLAYANKNKEWKILGFLVAMSPDAQWLGIAMTTSYQILVGIFIEFDVCPSDTLAPLLYEFAAGTAQAPVLAWTTAGASMATTFSVRYISMLALLLYSSTAIFIAIYRAPDFVSNAHDVAFRPAFLVLERILKEVLAIASILLIQRPSSSQSDILFFLVILLAIQAILLFSILLLRPCSFALLDNIRLLFLVFSMTVTLVALLAASGGGSNEVLTNRRLQLNFLLAALICTILGAVIQALVFLLRRKKKSFKRNDSPRNFPSSAQATTVPMPSASRATHSDENSFTTSVSSSVVTVSSLQQHSSAAADFDLI